MQSKNQAFAFLLNNFLILGTIQTNNPNFFLILNLTNTYHLLLASIKDFFKELTILFLKLLTLDFVNKFPKLYGLVKYFCIALHILETFTDFQLILVDFVIKLWVNIDDTLYLYVFVRFLCLNVALPKLIELFEMQKLKMFFAYLRKCSINHFLHFFLKYFFFWIEF